MQTVIYARITKSDLIRLFGVHQSTLDLWQNQGLPVEADGRFLLTRVLRWREQQHRAELTARVQTLTVSQRQLGKLLGVSRQTLAAWTRAGLKRGKQGYELPAVVRWLQCHCRRTANAEYEKRLAAIRRKLRRNIEQLDRFLT